jgi:hypothetical protein
MADVTVNVTVYRPSLIQLFGTLQELIGVKALGMLVDRLIKIFYKVGATLIGVKLIGETQILTTQVGEDLLGAQKFGAVQIISLSMFLVSNHLQH